MEKRSENGHEDGGPSLTRRQAVGLMGAAAAVAASGAKVDRAEASGIVRSWRARGLDCVVTPAQTEGPYFVDDRLLRPDIRSDPATGEVSAGIPLRLRLAVARVDADACAPVEGALVDVWQCDAAGVYSDVEDFQGLFDTRGRHFLRGCQETGRDGVAEFLTVYPGWYEGRAVHIHFKVRLAEGERFTREFTSQLYFDDALTDRVYAMEPYAAKGARDTRNPRDGIYRRGDSGSHLILNVTEEEDGYAGSFAIGLDLG